MTDELSSVQVAEQLANERRQAVIRILDEEDKITLRYLSELLAEYEEKKRKGIYIALIQSHIPKMEDFGVVEQDERQSIVMPGDNFEQVSEGLSAIETQEERERSALLR